MAGTDLVVADLAAGWAGTVVVEGLGFRLGAGGRLGLIGRNGAGKSTTLAAIIGLADCRSGTIRLGDTDLRQLRPHGRARAGLGFVPQTRGIFPSLTVAETLIAGLNGSPRRELDRAYDLFPRLAQRRGNLGAQLSGGEQQMLAIARALMGRPRLLLLDEPLEGLSPIVADEVMAAILRLAGDTGIGCILVEQHVDVVLDFAQDVIVLERGRAAFAGPVADLRAAPAILDSAIGLAKGNLP